MANIQKLGDSISVSESRVIPLLSEGDLVLYCTVKITTTNEEWQNKMFIVMEDNGTYTQLRFSNGVVYHMLRVHENSTNNFSIVIDGIYIPLKPIERVIPFIGTVIIPGKDTKKVTIPIESDMQNCSVSYNGTTTTLVTQVERTSTYLRFERQDSGSCGIVQLTRGTDIVAHYHVCFRDTVASKPPIFVITPQMVQQYQAQQQQDAVQRANANMQLTNPLRVPISTISPLSPAAQQLQSQQQQQVAFNIDYVKKTLFKDYLDLFVWYNDTLYPAYSFGMTAVSYVPRPLNASDYTPTDVKITKKTPLYLSFSNNVTVIVSKHPDETRLLRCSGLTTYLFSRDTHKREIVLQEEPASKKQK